MLLTVILGIVNLILSAVGTYAFGLPGFDITAVGVIMIALSGENPLIGSIVLSIAYMLPSPGRFIWLIPQVIVGFSVAWLAMTFGIIILPIFLYFVLSAVVGGVSGAMSGRYMMSIFIGLCLNIVIGRIYGFMM